MCNCLAEEDHFFVGWAGGAAEAGGAAGVLAGSAAAVAGATRLFRMTISTRRLVARPSSVSLDAFGMVSA
jgi:hypothetical protein